MIWEGHLGHNQEGHGMPCKVFILLGWELWKLLEFGNERPARGDSDGPGQQ